MDKGTHKIQKQEFKVYDLKGHILGEFDSNSNKLDGRSRFLSNDKNIVILCYFKQGII